MLGAGSQDHKNSAPFDQGLRSAHSNALPAVGTPLETHIFCKQSGARIGCDGCYSHAHGRFVPSHLTQTGCFFCTHCCGPHTRDGNLAGWVSSVIVNPLEVFYVNWFAVGRGGHGSAGGDKRCFDYTPAVGQYWADDLMLCGSRIVTVSSGSTGHAQRTMPSVMGVLAYSNVDIAEDGREK
jgi:hypothetical protein